MSFAPFPLLHIAVGSKDLSEVSDRLSQGCSGFGLCLRGPMRRQGGVEPEDYLAPEVGSRGRGRAGSR